MDEQLPVAGYFRVSQARDDMKAPDLYRDDIDRYCSYRNLTVGHVFEDIDYSGYRGAKPRPALEELKLRRYEFSAVVIPKLSRFGRSVKDLVNLFDLFDRDGIALHFLDMNLDTSTSQGRLLRHIMAAFAEYESDVKSDYAKATQRMLAREGRPHGPTAPFGYKIVGSRGSRTYAPHEPGASAVRDIFERYLAGGSIADMTRTLTEQGIQRPWGGEWTPQRIKTILGNPAYAGFRIYDGEEFPANWPPLVSRETYDTAKRIRQERRVTFNTNGARRTYLLTDLLICGVCGRRVSHTFGEKRKRIYVCHPGSWNKRKCRGGVILAERAERIVTEAFFDICELAGTDGMRAAWADADLSGRRDLLATTIARVVLPPRPEGNRHGRGGSKGRPLRIEWGPKVSRRVFGYVGASSTLSLGDARIVSPLGKTWAEWRRARLLPK